MQGLNKNKYSRWINGASQTLFLLLALTCVASAQVPGVVFSNANYNSAASSSGTNQDFSASMTHVASNARGDVFFVNNNFSGNPDNLIEVPAGTNQQIIVVTNLEKNSGSVTVDFRGNLWALTNTSGIVYIPFVNGTYQTGIDLTTLPVCNSGSVVGTSPCTLYQYYINSAAFGYYDAMSDIAVDASNDIYAVDWADGVAGYNVKTRLVKYDAVNGGPSVLVDNLPVSGGNGRLALAPNGDLYYVDRVNAYYVPSGSSTATTLTGFSKPGGVSADLGGNIYVTDYGTNLVYVLPNINGTVNPQAMYSLGNLSSVSGPFGSAGIDAFGTVSLGGGGYGGDLFEVTVGHANLGSIAVGSTTGPQNLDVTFSSAATFGGFKLTGAAGSTSPFALPTSGCTVGTAYAAGASCSVGITYTASAAGPQAGFLQAYDNSGNLLGSARLSGVGVGSVLNVDPGVATAVGSGWKDPSAIAVDGSGNNYVADSATGDILMNGGTNPIVTGFNTPSGVVIDGAGNLYVADSGNSRIVRVPFVNGAYGTPVPVLTGTSGLTGIAIDSSSNLYVADSGNARVLMLGSAANLPVGSNPTSLGSGYTTPTALAVDGSGNVYVSDTGAEQVVQYNIASGLSTPIVTGLSGAAGVAVDAGGNLFYADSGKQTITRVPNVGGALSASSSTTLPAVVTTPSAIALDGLGNLYATDKTASTVASLSRTSAQINFGLVVVSHSSQVFSATVSDGGNAALTLSTPYETGDTAAFAIQSSSTCADGASVAVGGTCGIDAVFTPSANGVESDTVTVSASGASVPLVLTGTGTGIIDVTITGATTLVYGNGAEYTVTATQDGTFTVNISGSATASTSIVVAGGKGSFTIPVLGVGNYTIGIGGTVGTATLAVTPATLTAVAANATRVYGTANPVLTSTVTGAVNGDSFVGSATTTATASSTVGTYPIVPVPLGKAIANYNVVATNGVFTITQGTSAVKLGVSGTILLGQAEPFVAVVSSPTGGKPTGTVSFVNVTETLVPVTLGSATLDSTGTGTYTTSTLPAGTIFVNAHYSGDANFGPSDSGPIGVTVQLPYFTLALSNQALQIVQGQSQTVTITVTPVGNFTSPVTFSCQGLPL